MSLITKIQLVTKEIGSLILGEDETVQPKTQLNFFYDYLANHYLETHAENLKELVSILKEKHAVDSICVANPNGSILISTDSNIDQALTGTALFNYVNSEIPKSQSVMIQANGHWFMLMEFNKKIYIIKARCNLTTIELKAIAKEVENFLLKKQEELIATQLE